MAFESVKKYWQGLRERAQKSVIVRQWRNLKSLLSYMRSQVIKRMPVWREDAKDLSNELKEKYSHNRDDFREKRRDWKETFSKIDASPEKLHEMLFNDRSKVGKLFESFLIILIIASVIVVMLDSVTILHRRLGWLLIPLEWIFTIVFTIEFILRIYSSPHPIKYVTSFFGLIDFITILPTYISLFIPGAHTFLVLRILRVFRIFRLLKLVKMMRAGNTIAASLQASKEKIIVFLIFVVLIVTIMGSLLYIIEAGNNSGFTSIPISIYWAIVTLTTVGYGDIAPSSWLGQLVAAAIMITGYAVIAVPTGIVSAELSNQRNKAKALHQECPRCAKDTHEEASNYCSQCGERLSK